MCGQNLTAKPGLTQSAASTGCKDVTADLTGIVINIVINNEKLE